jgi:alpha-D-xyloside xylohydrolase
MLRRALTTGAVPLLFGLLSCADTDDTALAGQGPPSQAPSLEAGEFEVKVAASPFELRLERNGAVLLRFDSDALQIGEVAAQDPKYNYDPYGLYEKVGLYREPDRLAWRSVEDAEVKAATTQEVELDLRFAGNHRATLRLRVRGSGSVEATWKPEDGARIGYMKVRPRVDGSEGFYGLGEYFDDVNHRGKLRAMQIEIDAGIDSGYNEVHVPIPFVIGSRGWGLFIDSRRPAVFDVARQNKEIVEATFGTGLGSGEGLTFHLFGAARPLDVTKLYYEVTGYPKLPARWALGPWIWRDENKDQAEVEADIDKLRDLDLATTGLWIDRPYATGVNTFDFKKEQFPDPAAMIAKLHASGLRTALWHTPYLDEKDPATQEDLAEAKSKGYFPPQIGPRLNKWGDLLDLTNPAAYSWWQERIKRYQVMGIEGYKLDYGEDVVPGIGSVRSGWSFFDGSDDQTAHNTYQIPYHKVYAETLPEEGGFLLCRHAVHGEQTTGIIIWPGDLDATFARHREKTVDPKSGKEYSAVGGLIASLIAGLSLGPSGFPFYGADTGGYRYSPPDKELFIRWFQQTALSSVMQVGTSSNTVAWEFDKNPGFDQELLDLYRVYTRLHLRLWPYAWTLAQQIASTGHPIQRPFGLAYPELGEHPSDQYLFGPDLLVAPVVDRGLTSRTVLFPPGRWVDWWTGAVVEGGAWITVDAPLSKLPLYLRRGGIIPMLRPTIDTMAPTTLPDKVDSYATTPGLLYLRIFPDDGASFSLFDGTLIQASALGAGPSVQLKPGAEFRFGAQIEILALPKKPGKVRDGGVDLPELPDLPSLESSEQGWFFDAQGSLHARIKAGERSLTVQP